MYVLCLVLCLVMIVFVFFVFLGGALFTGNMTFIGTRCSSLHIVAFPEHAVL